MGQIRAPDDILLINDGSRDDTRQMIERLARLNTRIRVIDHSQNLGLAATRDTGLQAAAGSLVAALDADTCPDSHWLATLLPYFED